MRVMPRESGASSNRSLRAVFSIAWHVVAGSPGQAGR